MVWDEAEHLAVIRHDRRWWAMEAVRAAAAIAAALVVWAVTDSVVLAAFWAAMAAYSVNTLVVTRYGEGLGRRAVVAAAALAAATAVLALLTAAWGRSWLAAAAALIAGGAAHLAIGRLVAPAFIEGEQREAEREWMLDRGSRASWDGPTPKHR
jgi:hypothetical protein